MISDARILGIFYGSLSLIAVIFAFSVCLIKDKERAFRAEAVERGHAEWTIDPKGKVTIKWKEVKP